MISISTKFKSKFIQQYQKLHTMQNFMSHQLCPNFMISNNSTIQKCPKTKSTTWSHKDFQPNHTIFKIPTKTNNNKMIMSHHQALNKTWNQKICQQRNKKWAHLKVHFGWMWSMASRFLKEPLFLIPFKGWMIFLPIESKKRWPLRRCHESAKKKKIEVWRWVSRKWVCCKGGQELKDLKRYWGKWLKSSLEA